MAVFWKGAREELIDQIAVALHQVKAYDLPNACVQLGLAPGESTEAHTSKRLYVRSRLQSLSNEKLLEIALQVDDSYPNFALCELRRKLEETDGPQLSDLTRRAIVNELERTELFGDLHLVEELKKLGWPIAEMDGPYAGTRLEESIYQHCIRNPEDWSNSFLLDTLGIITCSRRLFYNFLEAVVSPYAHKNEEQKNLVEAINKHLKADGYQLQHRRSISGYPVFEVFPIAGGGVSGAPKNLIFAADGPKPEIVLSDAINNDIKIVKNEDNCLVYDRPIGTDGLSKGQLIEWWKDRQGITHDTEARRTLYDRLTKSLASEGEKNLFRSYYQTFKNEGDELPALIPQVYLHYDPYTARELGGITRLVRQRMDFLILFSSSVRIVLEVDGSQHFSEDDKPSLDKYAEMMAADRELRLAGYEVYRFGANELCGKKAPALIEQFFHSLLRKQAAKKSSKA